MNTQGKEKISVDIDWPLRAGAMGSGRDFRIGFLMYQTVFEGAMTQRGDQRVGECSGRMESRFMVAIYRIVHECPPPRKNMLLARLGQEARRGKGKWAIVGWDDDARLRHTSRLG